MLGDAFLRTAAAAGFFGMALLAVGGAAAGDPVDLTQASQLAQRSTVTLRVLARDSRATAAPATAEESDPWLTESDGPRADRVAVFSGVAVAPGLVATTSYVAQGEIRVTLSGGKQAIGRLKALDEYSQLALVEVVDEEVAPVPLAEQQAPQVGQWVISAAAWGAEPAVISLGIISGLERRLDGADLPPLIQCDLRSASTTGGAGVFDHQGCLVGVVLAVEGQQARPGWAYAAPVKHVRRLLRAVQQQRAAVDGSADSVGDATAIEAPAGQAPTPPDDARVMFDDSQILVLKRLRPTMGMVLESEDERVIVRRIQPQSPAQRAGLQEGDEVVAVNGLQIRSVYQAVRPVLNRQPGDTLQLLVRRDQRTFEMEVVLGGAVSASSDVNSLQAWRQPRVEISRDAAARPPLPAEVAAGDGDLVGAEAAADPVAILQRALDAYRAAVDAQQRQLRETQAALEQARRELQELRQKNDD